jgi:hypothetical protein
VGSAYESSIEYRETDDVSNYRAFRVHMIET